MKRSFLLLVVIVFLFMSGCNTNQQAEQADFQFCSLTWGETWENVQKEDVFQDVLYEVSENGHRLTVKAQQMEYLGVTIDTVGLVFDVRESSETKGLVNVFLQFSEENEAALLEKLTQIYGERKNSYNKSTDEKTILDFCSTPRSREEIADFLGISSVTYAITRYVTPLVKEGKLLLSIPESPKSPRQRYISK